jgi:hypothetical protein
MRRLIIDRIHLYRDGVKNGTDLKAPVSPAAKPDAIQAALKVASLPGTSGTTKNRNGR